MKSVTIEKAGSAYAREPGQLGFAGGNMTAFFQKAVALQDSEGNVAGAFATLNPLWCDKPSYKRLQDKHGNEKGEALANLFMSQTADFVLNLLEGRKFSSPGEALDEVLLKAHWYHRQITKEENLPLTSTLNALVPVDIANYVLHAKANGIDNFDGIIPVDSQRWFTQTIDQVAIIPLVSYSIDQAGIEALIRDGYKIFKTKMGAYNPAHDMDSDADMEAMFETDTQKALLVYNLIKDLKTDLTEDGRVPIYLDFNGRLGTGDKAVELLQKYVEFAKQNGFLDRVIVFEEPFSNMMEIGADVYKELKEAGITIVADECAHSAEDVGKLLRLGVRGFALKPAAKTYTETFRMVDAIEKYNAKADSGDKAFYFCADLTVVPWLVDANLQFTARSSPWPGLANRVRMLETNWRQHYDDLPGIMHRYTPSFVVMQENNGVFRLNEQWYKGGGSLFNVQGPLYEMAKQNMRLL